MKWKGSPLRTKGIRGACALVFLLFVSVSNVYGQDASLEGKRVAAVRVVDDSGNPIPEKVSPAALKPGDAFQMTAERDALRQLNQTGLFSDVRTSVTTATDGLHVDFIVTRNYYNNVVRVFGLKEPPNEATALAALQLPLGSPFQLADLNAGLERLRQTLQDDGFYEAKWQPGMAKHPETHQIDVTVEVTPGRRAKLSAVNIKNETPFSEKDLRGKLKLKKGTSVTAERIDRGTERLRNYLVASGYLEARVTATRGNLDSNSSTLPLDIDVVAGPRVSVSVSGTKISSKEIRKLVPVYQEGDVDPDLLEEGKRNIRDLLQKEGYFDSTVSYATHLDPVTHVDFINYTIERGIKHRLVGVVIEGNRYFSTDVLRSRLQVQQESLFSRGRFSQGMVLSDANSMAALYISNGFLQSQVHPNVKDDYEGKKGNLFVVYEINEGQQTHVADLKLVGNSALTTKQLLTVIGSTKGQPYSQSNVTSDRDNILAYYFDQGFPNAQFDYKATPVGVDQVELVFQITEGQRVDVSQVLLAGYRYTRPGIISRQVVVKAGGPLREGDRIATQQKLYNLAVFDRVEVAPQNPEGDYPNKTVVVAVQEGQRYTLSYGFGFEAQRLASTSNPNTTNLNASPLGILEVSKINVGGRAHTVSLKLRGSTLEYQGLLSYTAPNFLTYSWLNLIITGLADQASYVNTFTATRYEGSVQLSQTVSPSTTLLYRYFYRHVTATSLKVSVEEVPLFSQPTKVSGFEGTWVRDRRDNPADATHGSFNTADFSVATRSLGSTATFLRFSVQNSTFTPFRRSSLVFARSTTFGIMDAFNGSAEDDIPLAERFFAGGGTTLRGFSLNQAGPRDPTTGFPVGGLAMLVFNQELRFPMHLPLVGSHLGGAFFYDAGNVFSDIHHVSLRYTPLAPPSGCQPGTTITNTLSECPNLNYFSHTVGFGFRYATPIGPVRLDFAYQINPAEFQSENTNTKTISTSQLPHFQFFFNIGSIF
ncbi:MAG TPA: POTRA domain-containing protein [Candidatus Acidoferrales bacterium]|nr:POTRA domain-containing protein [Candidatus Acidoferrales bacterium]